MIYIRDLAKSFANNHVLNNLNLNVGKGDIYAIVGKNGAGKTTLMRLLSGLLVPDSGSISINSNKTVGVLLGGDVHLYGNLTSLEILHYFGVLHGLPSAYISARIVELNSVLNFNDYLTRKAKELSRGMRQKIAFAVAIIHDPDVLLLDEPSLGLAPLIIKDIFNTLKEIRKELNISLAQFVDMRAAPLFYANKPFSYELAFYDIIISRDI